MVGRTALLLVEGPSRLAGEAHGAVAGGAARGARHALAPLLVGEEAIGARGHAPAVGRPEVPVGAGHALLRPGTRASLARLVARRTATQKHEPNSNNDSSLS